ncbi:hypothetical protein O6P43_013156 [Quillaja saponaria]|uniref:Uncharacterized protein n=1 Tax=Quillaja saponaria TaxID=32244 RepID=A0AAD7M354_QUISA|nr:hypothetical protein O6P43_013156 [Quillaja saponaria]
MALLKKSEEEFEFSCNGVYFYRLSFPTMEFEDEYYTLPLAHLTFQPNRNSVFRQTDHCTHSHGSPLFILFSVSPNTKTPIDPPSRALTTNQKIITLHSSVQTQSLRDQSSSTTRHRRDLDSCGCRVAVLQSITFAEFQSCRASLTRNSICLNRLKNHSGW